MTDLRSLMNTFDRNYIVAMFNHKTCKKLIDCHTRRRDLNSIAICGSQAGYLDLF